MTRSIIRTATIALAAAALAAPAASARPADMPPALARAAAAAQQKQADVGDYPTRPAQGEQANPRLETTTTATTTAPAERDIAWTTIAIGFAGSLIALTAITGIVKRTRRGGARVTA